MKSSAPVLLISGIVLIVLAIWFYTNGNTYSGILFIILGALLLLRSVPALIVYLHDPGNEPYEGGSQNYSLDGDVKEANQNSSPLDDISSGPSDEPRQPL